MTHDQLQALCELLMVSDPNPCGEANHTLLTDLADEAAEQHGYQNWTDAYHQIRSDSGQFGVGA